MVDLGKTLILDAEDTGAAAPGYKTTEFWVTLLGTVITFIASQNLASEGSIWATVTTAALAVLAALGYTASRAVTKRERIRAAALSVAAQIEYLTKSKE